MEPDKHDLVLATAAYAGYRTIGLSYENRVSVEDACSGANACGNDCQGKARLEAVLGTDVSPEAHIKRGDSVLERLYRVLEYLDANDPAGGWSSYYVPTGGNITSANIVWSQIIISGFSQGAGHAALISRKMQVHGLFIIDGGNDTCDGAAGPLPAEWTTLLPDASSGRRKYGVVHRRNAPMPYAPSATWQALGLGPSGLGLPTSGLSLDGTGGVDVVDSNGPMRFSYTNQSFPGDPQDPQNRCSEHTSMARDECMPANFEATAVAATAPGSRLFAPYLKRFCYACDQGTCP